MNRVAATGLALLALVLSPAAASGETLYHAAENDVPVAMTEIRNLSGHTEIRLETLAPIPGVCWYASGPHRPYLLAGGRRYGFLGGDFIEYCPSLRDYGQGAVMILRFEPLDPGVRSFHFVEGEGGERQINDPGSSATRYWNFIGVDLR